MSYIASLLSLALLAWAIFSFNRLVRLRNQVRAGWSDIGVQLTRRHDLVPMLVDAVRAYAGHEKSVFERVSALRAAAMTTSTPARLATVEAALEHEVGRLMLIQEAYPDLKASENFLKLQRDLVSVEDHLQYARRFYNGAVRELSNGVQRFPDLLIATELAPKLDLGS
jgi:LemA protein